MFRTEILLRPTMVRPRDTYALHTMRASLAFPLLRDNRVLPKMVRSLKDYQGRRQFDDDHQLPVLDSKSNVQSNQHRWTTWDKYLNPQLMATPAALDANAEYVGRRTGYLAPLVGWRRIGSSWKFSRHLNDMRKGWARGTWQERAVTPRWKLVPRIADHNFAGRYPGKLEFLEVPLTHIVRAIDMGVLNRNEVITLWHLRDAGIVQEREVVWPGVKLTLGGLKELRYPLSLELQHADASAIGIIERAGGDFTAAYLSIEGLYQHMRPEEYPVFIDQHMPDRQGMERVAGNPGARGYLAKWLEDESKYAHPDAGRRLSHYVSPPHARDFPANYEEFERVRHHQKWHLNQPGTGTILPWISENSAESQRAASQQIIA
jgi:ribosomal protein L15